MTAISAANIGTNASGSGVSSGVTGSTAWGTSSQLITAHATWIANTSNNRSVSSFAGASLTLVDCGAGRQTIAIDGTSSLYHQVFYVVGNGNTETLTITLNGTVDFLRTHFVRFSGDMDLGNAGANAIVQHPTNTGTATTQTITLAAFGDAVNNAAIASWGTVGVGSSSSPGSGWTEIHDFSQASQAVVYTEFQLGQDTSADYTAPGSQVFAGIALEIKAASTNKGDHTSGLYRGSMRGSFRGTAR